MGIHHRIAAANGRVLVSDTHNVLLLTVDGKTLAVQGARTTIAGGLAGFNSNINAITTDGAGNWYLGSDAGDGGDIAVNTNNADPSSWSLQANQLNKSAGGVRRIFAMSVDRYLPL